MNVIRNGMVGLGVGFEVEQEGGGGDGATATAEGAAEGSQDGAGGAEGTGGATSQENEQGEASGGGGKGNRAQDRIRQLANESRDTKAQLQQALAEIERLKTPAEQREAQERRKKFDQDFYKDPAGHVQQMREELRNELNGVISQQQDLTRYQSGLETLRTSPGFSAELEQAMIKAIERHGLGTPSKVREHGKFGVLKLAYETVTGKEWGHWAQDGYNTRKTKERLSRPGTGGGQGSGQGGSMLSPQEYDAQMLSLSRKQIGEEEHGLQMQKLNAALDRWMEAQQG